MLVTYQSLNDSKSKEKADLTSSPSDDDESGTPSPSLWWAWLR